MAGKTAAELFDMTGKVAVVTGGSRGMGKEMVRAFANAGADVVIASRKIDACEELAAEITEATGRRALPVACHVGYWDQCDQLAETDSLYDVTESLYDKVMEVNLKGPFRLSAAFGKRMADGDGGSIINVSSIAAADPSPNETAYGAAKAGLHAITKSFAREYAPKVRVNCIMPGPFLTDIALAWDTEQFNQRAAETIALQRGGEADEVVGAALYFASAASSYTTGSILKIDGGACWAAS
jgi:NAD(P)-dependent dehydrogenase (short-subunit alcohol dehydrogenase family)